MTTLSTTKPKVNDPHSLRHIPRWVTWVEEKRERKDGTAIKTKIPYDPNSQEQAKIPTEPSTWGTRAEAEQRWERLKNSGRKRGGIGLVLGDLGDGTHLLGIDLDSCLEKTKEKGEFEFEQYANNILSRLDTYSEVSPSGRGVKLFFLVADEDMPAVRKLLDDKTRKAFTAGQHREIALDRSRYYAVTGSVIADLHRFRVVGVEDIRWLIREAGPAFLEQYGGGTSSDGTTKKKGRDESGSGYGLRFMGGCKALRKTYEQACADILRDTGRAGEWARRVDEDQLKRAWKHSPAKLFDDFVKPKQLDVPPAITAWELSQMEFPPIKYVVPDIIVEGVSIFAGKPKIGKSWMMLQIANAVATGDVTLGGIHCSKGDVLYCALEDGPRRLQSRMEKLGIERWSVRRQRFWDRRRPNLRESLAHPV
jgi:AAA domain